MTRALIVPSVLLWASLATADVLDTSEWLYESTRVACEFASRCSLAMVEPICKDADAKKDEWRIAKEHNRKMPSRLERADWDKCAAAAKGGDCTKYHVGGFSQFVADGANSACGDYSAFLRHTGKYAPTK